MNTIDNKYFSYFNETKYLMQEYARFGGSVIDFCNAYSITLDFFTNCVKSVLDEINSYNTSFEWLLDFFEISKKDFLDLTKQILSEEQYKDYIL